MASRDLHDHVEPGAFINSRKPAGDFVLPRGGSCPIVLVSAGIGVTPMVSMLHMLAAESRGASDRVRPRHARRAHHALGREVRGLAARRAGIRVHIAYSRPRPEDKIGTDYDGIGRIDGELSASLGADPDAHDDLCGPTGFLGEVQSARELRGISADHIHTESFGPSS